MTIRALFLSTLLAISFAAPLSAQENTATSITDSVKAAPVRKIKGDLNGDGLISRDEYLARYVKQFEAIDTNRDNFISYEEHKAAAAARAKKAEQATPPPPTEEKSFLKRFFN